MSDGMLNTDPVCTLSKFREMDSNKLRDVAAVNGFGQGLGKSDGCKLRKRTSAESLEDIEHKLEEGGPLLVPSSSSEFSIVSKRKRPNSKAELVPVSCSQFTIASKRTSIRWSVKTWEGVKKLRCVARTTPWLCSPRLLCNGISCEKCSRHWARRGPARPAEFCAHAGCLASSVPVPSKGERIRMLCELGLMRHNSIRSVACAAGSLDSTGIVQPKRVQQLPSVVRRNVEGLSITELFSMARQLGILAHEVVYGPNNASCRSSRIYRVTKDLASACRRFASECDTDTLTTLLAKKRTEVGLALLSNLEKIDGVVEFRKRVVALNVSIHRRHRVIVRHSLLDKHGRQLMRDRAAIMSDLRRLLIF